MSQKLGGRKVILYATEIFERGRHGIYSPVVKWVSRLAVNQLFYVRVVVGELSWMIT